MRRPMRRVIFGAGYVGAPPLPQSPGPPQLPWLRPAPRVFRTAPDQRQTLVYVDAERRPLMPQLTQLALGPANRRRFG